MGPRCRHPGRHWEGLPSCAPAVHAKTGKRQLVVGRQGDLLASTCCHCLLLLPPSACCRLVDAAGQQTWMLTAAELGVEPGQFTFSVVAKNANGESQNATTQPLIVGTPGAPSWTTANRVVTGPSTATLSWTAPEYNARIGTRYYAQLWRDANTRFGDLVALTPAAGTNGTEAAPFTATMRVTAGGWGLSGQNT